MNFPGGTQHPADLLCEASAGAFPRPASTPLTPESGTALSRPECPRTVQQQSTALTAGHPRLEWVQHSAGQYCPPVSSALLCLQGPRALEGYSTQLATFAWRTGTDSFDDDMDDLKEEGSSSSGGIVVPHSFLVLTMAVQEYWHMQQYIRQFRPSVCLCTIDHMRGGRYSRLSATCSTLLWIGSVCPWGQQRPR